MVGAALVGYVITLPLIRVELVTVAGKTIVPADLCFLALVAVATWDRAWRRPPPWLVVVVALPPLATATAALFDNAAGAYAPIEIGRAAYSMATLLALACLDVGRDHELVAIRTWTLTAVAACLIGLVALVAVLLLGVPANPLARPNSPNLGPHVIRVSGLLETNALLLYLLMAGAFAAYLARFGESTRDRRLGTAALLLMSVTALAALSRGAVGFVLATALLAWRAQLAPTWLSRRRMAVGAAAGLLFAAGVAATLWGVFPISLRSEPGRAPSLDWNRRPNAYRVLHSAGLRMFAAHPVSGVGPGRFGERFAEFTTPEERKAAWPPMDPRRRWSPHSTWIGFAAEGGLVLLAGWLIPAAWLVQRLLGLQPMTIASTAPYLGLSLVGLFANGLHVDFHHLKFVWAAIGAALGHRAASVCAASRCANGSTDKR